MIRRSEVTADTLPKEMFVLIGPSANADTLEYIDEPRGVADLLGLIREYLERPSCW
jgi:hypothetical protein